MSFFPQLQTRPISAPSPLITPQPERRVSVRDIVHLLVELKNTERRLEELETCLDDVRSVCPSKTATPSEILTHAFVTDVLPNLPHIIITDEQLMRVLMEKFGLTPDALIPLRSNDDAMDIDGY